jgi:ABC-type oligopeptide transport system substrate-binding subunit
VSVDPETQELAYGAAESIDSPDGKVWTVKLRPGMKFHNGEPVDAESYVRAWNYYAYGPNTTQAGFFLSPVQGYDDLQGKQPKAKELSGVKVVDDTTIEITLDEAFSQWPLNMSYAPAFIPMAQECLDDVQACNEQPIGTGPYQMSEPWQHNESVTMEKWEDYEGDDPANADSIEMLMYADLKTAFRDWQAGNLDIVDGVDPSQVEQAQAEAGERWLSVDDGSYTGLGFPTYIDMFDDVRIRRALSMAIDRETIADRILMGQSTPAMDYIAPFVPGSRDDACEYCVYDPEEAKRLFDEAGGIPGNTVTIFFNNDGGHEGWTQAVGEGWKNVLGLDYELASIPFTPWLNTLDEGKSPGAYRQSWIPDYPSPENYLDPVYGEGTANYSRYQSDEFLRLIAEADAAPSIEEGIPIYQEAADVALEDLQVAPLFFGKTEIVYSERLDNVNYDPLQQILLGEISVTG